MPSLKSARLLAALFLVRSPARARRAAPALGWLLASLMGLGPAAIMASAQTSSAGAVNVTVLDSAGAAVPNAELLLKDLGTNDVRKAQTQINGAHSFPNLPFGVYELRVSAPGFESQVFGSVQVQTGRITTITARLEVGGTTESVTVTETATPLLETESGALADTIDTKQVLNLPIVNRNVMGLAFLVPGWASTGAAGSGGPNTNGTWNNMPGGAVVSVDFDGTPGISNRFRSGGFNYGTSVVQPRIENVAEMTVSTAQLDLGGNGTSAMRISVVSRRGTNAFHGRLFEDLRNSALQANSWINNARGLRRGVINLNDFGGNVGGPIRKDKLFFFFTYAQSVQPQSNTATSPVLTPAAQQGNLTYVDTGGVTRTVNLLQIAGNAGYPSTVLPNIADQLQKINGSTRNGSLTAGTDPNIQTLSFRWANKITTYYPAIRVDYNATNNLRFNWSYSQQKNTNFRRYNEQFPGIDPLDLTSSAGNNRIAGFGFDWTIRPTLVNEFHAGYMYQYSVFSPENLGLDLPNLYRQNWGYARSLYGQDFPRRPISSLYPLLNWSDSLTWQKGSHTLMLGGTWYREQDHYWNGPGGEPNYNFGIVAQDPLGAVFTSALTAAPAQQLTNAQNLYALLTGRVSGVTIGVGRPLDAATKQYKPFGAYNLNEVMQAGGFWVQDRWRLKPNLTLNYGIRWDIVGDDYDVSGAYSSPASVADLWGPTPVGALFQSGRLGGVPDPVFQARQHVYKASKVSPQPAAGIAWSPRARGGILARLLGQDKTVIRTGYSLRQYTEGAQNFWAFASNSGQFFFQSGALTANPTPALGNFQPGSLTFGDPLPPYLLTPATYSATVPASDLFGRNAYWGMNPNIRQPYVQQWNLGVQRQIGNATVLEVRYVGNLSLHQWLSYNLNETNIMENGFLQEFIAAQNNLRINQANGRGNSFAHNGLAGQVPLPIFTAAFGPATGNYTNGAFITNLQTGAVGTLANALASNVTFFCNMVGSNAFPACVSRGIITPGAGYPINFWNVNPYATGRAVNYLDAAGHSNYHGLQIQLRQRPTHGMQFNVNYTWAKSLGVSAQNGIQGMGNNIYYTARNFKLNYGPGIFDIRHVLRISGTYDLPFGKGRMLLNRDGGLDRVFGGWTIGTIATVQSGTPAVMSGGFGTLNTNDSGVALNGITVKDFQRTVGVYRGSNPWVMTFDPKFVGTNGAANEAYLRPFTTPGQWGYRPYIYGPGWYSLDLSLNKRVQIRESLRFLLQAEFLNALNHPTFSLGGIGVQGVDTRTPGLTFGQSTGGPTGPRIIEFRANIEF